MKFDESILRTSTARGIRLVALGYLDDARHAGKRLEDAHDPEALHDFRVAIRRSHSWLRAFSDDLTDVVRKKDVRALRDVVRATNSGRDIDVQIAWLREAAKGLSRKRRAGARWLANHLAARRRKAGDPVDAALLGEFRRAHDALAAALSTVEEEVRLPDEQPLPTLSRAIAMRVPTHAESLAEALARVHTVHDEAEAHEARIMAKRLRYLIEPAAPLVEQSEDVLERVKRIQDDFGALHDAQVLAHEISDAAELRSAPRDALTALADRVHAETEVRFERVRRNWLGDQYEVFARDLAAFVERLDS